MACERLLQISIECVIDIIHLLVKGMKLGLPGDEENMIDSLTKKGMITKELAKTLKEMKGFRNVLVHRYGLIEDERVFESISARLDDFETFKEAVLKALK